MAATVRKAASRRDPRIAILLSVAMVATRMRSRCGIFRSAGGLDQSAARNRSLRRRAPDRYFFKRGLSAALFSNNAVHLFNPRRR
jgi:hypothetical protein